MSESRAALVVRGVRKTFEAENAPVRALRGVNLTVEAGDFAALMGPSGCGKSMLLNLVAGLDTPDEGEITGAGAVIAVIYLVIVAGLGKTPDNSAERQLLAFSMLAAVVAAIGYLPVRGRLIASATRFVYGTREAPGEALRTFGSRMTRAVAMDELLLQLAESLRKSMRLDCAEVYTGAGDELERAVSVPDAGGRSVVLTDRERPVVAQAGYRAARGPRSGCPPCSTGANRLSCGWRRSATRASCSASSWWTESGGLLFSVTDDGPGFDPAAGRRGHGFVNMTDRLGAIGGTVRWDSRPGHGAAISGSVPLVP